MKPRVLFVGRTRYPLPLAPSLERKFAALGETMELRVLASAAPGARDEVHEEFVLSRARRPRLLDGPAFYVALPFRVARELRRFRPSAVVAQSPYEGAAIVLGRALARTPARLVVEVHGDWRTSTRLYGSRFRRLLAPLGDRIAAAALRRADAVRAVSAYTADLVRIHGVESAAVFRTYTDLRPFVERPVAPLPEHAQLLFVGVLERYKNVDGLVAAWRIAAGRLPAARLHIVGEGSMHPHVQRLVDELPDQTSWTPSLTTAEVAEALDESTALLLPSRSEGLPRVVVEAFCRGRPVLGGSAGGIPDAVEDGVNGLLVDPEDVDALADAIVRLADDGALARRLADGALASAEQWVASSEEYAAQVRQLVDLVEEERPRVLIVGRTRYRLPLHESLLKKFDALQEEVELRVIGSAPPGAPPGDGTFRLVRARRPRRLDGVLFYLSLPWTAARELRRFRPKIAIAQSPYEGAALLLARRLAMRRSRVVVEVHGDWRTATRLYGSPARRLLGPVADHVAAWALHHADAVRTVSTYTTDLVRDLDLEPAAVFPAHMDLAPFLERRLAPMPKTPTLLFVGVLEAYKNVDGLAEAWRLAAPRVSFARLRVVGSGTRTNVVRDLVADLPAQTAWDERLETHEVVDALDGATALVLPSRSEGMGRVIVEAFCRGRPVVGSRVGGIRDLIEDGVNGLLVDPADVDALADAMVRILTEPGLAERLGSAAHATVQPWLATPEQYADRVRALVEGVAAGA